MGSESPQPLLARAFVSSRFAALSWSGMGPSRVRIIFTAALVAACGETRDLDDDTGPIDGSVRRDAGTLSTLRARWIRLDIPGPPPCGQPAMAALDDRVVLFAGGGFRRGTFMDDTWIFEDGAWREIATSTTPPGRTGGMMASLGGRLILYGGLGEDETGLGVHDDTWAFDGEAWSIVIASGAPQIRRGGVAVVDDAIVSYSGLDDDLARSDATWIFDGNAWSERDVTPEPPPVRNAAMTTLDGYGFLHGGSAPAALSDVWRWDGAAWAEVGAFASGRAYHALGALGGHLVVFGGVRSSTNAIAETDAWPGPLELSGDEPPPHDDYTMVNLGDRVLLWGGAGGETWMLEHDE